MKNKSLLTGLFYAALIGLGFYFFSSCNPYGFEIWPEGDPHWNHPNSQGLLDTCENYQTITTPKFCTWAVNLDGFNGEYEFYYKPYVTLIPIDIDSFLNQYGVSHTFYSGINVCGIVDGLDNPSYMLNHSLYIKDQFGGLFQITLNKYNWTFNGTLTFEQFYNNLKTHLSFNRMGFWNTAFTCDEYNQILDLVIDNCVDGTGKVIDVRKIPSTCIDPERIQRLEDADFTIWQ